MCCQWEWLVGISDQLGQNHSEACEAVATTKKSLSITVELAILMKNSYYLGENH